MLSRAFFAGERFKYGELPEDKPSSGIDNVRDNGLLPFIMSDWMHILTAISYIFSKNVAFFYLGRNCHSHATGVRHDLATPSYVFLAPLFSSPSPDPNGGIDLLAIGSSDCLKLRLPQEN